METEIDLEREERILAGIERRNRRLLRTALVLVVAVVASVVALYLLLPEPTAAPAVKDRAAVVALVLSQDPIFASATEFDPAGIGVADWWKAEEVDGVWQVTVRLGWGDCPAGCISEHVYRYEVRGGTVQLLEEYGDPLSTRN
jgi:hypothetical protein